MNRSTMCANRDLRYNRINFRGVMSPPQTQGDKYIKSRPGYATSGTNLVGPQSRQERMGTLTKSRNLIVSVVEPFGNLGPTRRESSDSRQKNGESDAISEDKLTGGCASEDADQNVTETRQRFSVNVGTEQKKNTTLNNHSSSDTPEMYIRLTNRNTLDVTNTDISGFRKPTSDTKREKQLMTTLSNSLDQVVRSTSLSLNIHGIPALLEANRPLSNSLTDKRTTKLPISTLSLSLPLTRSTHQNNKKDVRNLEGKQAEQSGIIATNTLYNERSKKAEGATISLGLPAVSLYEPEKDSNESTTDQNVTGFSGNKKVEEVKTAPLESTIATNGRRKFIQVTFALEKNQCLEFKSTDMPITHGKRIIGWISSTGDAPGEGVSSWRSTFYRQLKATGLRPRTPRMLNSPKPRTNWLPNHSSPLYTVPWTAESNSNKLIFYKQKQIKNDCPKSPDDSVPPQPKHNVPDMGPARLEQQLFSFKQVLESGVKKSLIYQPSEMKVA